MGKQISFYEKNFLDFDNDAATITATDANDFAGYMRSRSLRFAWMTTSSVDADNTVIEIDLANTYLIDRIFLLDHNLKSFKVELYDFDAGTWSEKYSISDEEKSTTQIELEEFYGRRFRVTIYGTQVPDSDKRINRIVITKMIGRFKYWPLIESVMVDQAKVSRKTLSNRTSINRNTGVFACKLKIEHWRQEEDIVLIERLYRQVEGFQVWLSGGDESQFFYPTEGYREKDLYLMGITNEWQPNLKNGIYPNGFKVQIDLVEVVS